MWKPASVVPQHRNRAILVWVAILLTAVAYTVWQTAVVIKKRQNPSTKILVSNQWYQFPLVSVCLFDGAGCGYNGSTDACIASALWSSYALYRDIFIFAAQAQEENCVEFDLTTYEVPEGERESASNATVSISMDWVSSDNASAEIEYSAGVYVILGGSNNLAEADYTMVPYSRNVLASDDRNYETTAMTIGKTNRKYLSDSIVTNYPVLTIATTRFVTTKAWDQFSPLSTSTTSSSFQVTNDSAVGSLFLEVTQGSYSHTQVEDIEPLEIGALFGNVGGFWELLVLAWGVFFITKSRDAEPKLKARNFAKVLQRGAKKKRKRRKLDSAAAEEAGHDGARPPDWDASDDDMHASSASDSSASEKQYERSRRHRTHRSARPKRPVAHPLPRRVSFRSHQSSLGTSATASNTVVPSRRSSASVTDGTMSSMPSTASSRRWSGLDATGAASKFHSFDAGGMTQTRKAVFTVNGSRSGSFSNSAYGGDNGKARTSFFPTPQASSSRIRPDSEDESSRSATRPAHESSNFAEDGEDADDTDLELG